MMTLPDAKRAKDVFMKILFFITILLKVSNKCDTSTKTKVELRLIVYLIKNWLIINFFICLYEIINNAEYYNYTSNMYIFYSKAYEVLISNRLIICN